MPNKPNRRSIRLQGYDYSQEGLYFVTICYQDRICRFGDVVNGEMILNETGKMIDQWIQSYQNISQYIKNNPLNWGKDKFYS